MSPYAYASLFLATHTSLYLSPMLSRATSRQLASSTARYKYFTTFALLHFAC